jgi:hypothetical protein
MTPNGVAEPPNVEKAPRGALQTHLWTGGKKMLGLISPPTGTTLAEAFENQGRLLLN